MIRELYCGSTRFNDRQRGVPRRSPSLLSRRLKELEYAGIVEITPLPVGKSSQYRLTKSGEAMFPIIEQMGGWAARWLRHQLTADANLDPDLMMWDIRRRAIDFGEMPEGRHVVKFQFEGAPVSRRLYWLVLDGVQTDLCVKDPGHEVDLHVGCHLRVLTRIWLGQIAIAAAVANGGLRLDGSRAATGAFPKWFALSHFARFAAE